MPLQIITSPKSSKILSPTRSAVVDLECRAVLRKIGGCAGCWCWRTIRPRAARRRACETRRRSRAGRQARFVSEADRLAGLWTWVEFNLDKYENVGDKITLDGSILSLPAPSNMKQRVLSPKSGSQRHVNSVSGT